MSKIFDALKRAQGTQGPASHNGEPVPSQGERRRSPRRRAHVPIYVYGHTPPQQPFHEEAYSAVVSALGGLLVMSSTVRPGQTLLLTNKVTQKEQECRVAYVGGRDPQSVEVAVEFSDLAPDFWRLTAPPQPAQSMRNSEKQ